MNQEPGGWVSLDKIDRIQPRIRQYNRVIDDLKLGKVAALGKRKFNIETKILKVGRIIYSWRRLVEPARHPYQMEFMGMR